MSAMIPIPTDLAFRLLDEISRRRALADDESLLLEQIVTRGHRSGGVQFRWTPALDRDLWRASYRKGALRDFAENHGITPQAASNRLLRLREKKAARKASVTDKERRG